MTRVLIIGSSHVGAYKNAQAAFAEHYPGVTLDFFALRGPQFRTGKIDGHGQFAPVLSSDKDRDFVQTVNGRLGADTSVADHVVILGHRFAFGLLANALEDTPTPGEPQIRQTAETLTQSAIDKIAPVFAGSKAPLTFAMAPYPATSILERGDSYPQARTLGLFWKRPDAARIFDIWLGTVQDNLAAHGFGLLAQPATLNEVPHGTKPEFAARAHGLDGDKTGKTDHRHMNADYGLAMLCAFAETTLGLAPGAHTDTPTKRIA